MYKWRDKLFEPTPAIFLTFDVKNSARLSWPVFYLPGLIDHLPSHPNHIVSLLGQIVYLPCQIVHLPCQMIYLPDQTVYLLCQIIYPFGQIVHQQPDPETLAGFLTSLAIFFTFPTRLLTPLAGLYLSSQPRLFTSLVTLFIYLATLLTSVYRLFTSKYEDQLARKSWPDSWHRRLIIWPGYAQIVDPR